MYTKSIYILLPKHVCISGAMHSLYLQKDAKNPLLVTSSKSQINDKEYLL